MSGVSADAIADLDADAAVAVVVDLWERAGWTVETDAAGPQSALATRSADSGRGRVLLRVLAPDDERVDAEQLRQVVASVGVDANCVTAVSTTGFTRGALDVADAYGVDAVGPDAVVRLADALDATTELAARAQ